MEQFFRAYVDDLHENFMYYPSWTPDTHFCVGDVGTLDGGLFTKLTDLKTLAIPFSVSSSPTSKEFSFNSSGKFTIQTKFEGVPLPGTGFGINDIGFNIEVGPGYNTLMQLNNVTTESIENLQGVASVIGQRIENPDKGSWDAQWVFISEVKKAAEGTVIISNGEEAKIELKGKAGVSISNINIASIEANFAVSQIKNIGHNNIATKDMTPIFKLAQVKKHIFHKPSLDLSPDERTFGYYAPSPMDSRTRDGKVLYNYKAVEI